MYSGCISSLGVGSVVVVCACACFCLCMVDLFLDSSSNDNNTNNAELHMYHNVPYVIMCRVLITQLSGAVRGGPAREAKPSGSPSRGERSCARYRLRGGPPNSRYRVTAGTELLPRYSTEVLSDVRTEVRYHIEVWVEEDLGHYCGTTGD